MLRRKIVINNSNNKRNAAAIKIQSIQRRNSIQKYVWNERRHQQKAAIQIQSAIRKNIVAKNEIMKRQQTYNDNIEKGEKEEEKEEDEQSESWRSWGCKFSTYFYSMRCYYYF